MVAALPQSHQQTIRSRFAHVQHALEATDVSLPLYALVTDLPGSSERRRQQQRKLSPALVQNFAERIGETEEVAWAYLKNLLIYGPLGLLDSKDWPTCVHPRIWSYLWLFKLGRLDDVTDDIVLVKQVNDYADALGWPHLPSQIIIAMRNRFPKNDFYNSGDGDAIAGVPRRKTLKIRGKARLHEQWLLLHFILDMQLTDRHRRPVGEMCHVIGIFDCGCQRPINCLVQPHPPTEADLGIALYLAIWQPNNLSWPLRGVPETILIPEELAANGLQDINTAAPWLLATVETMKNPEKRLNQHPFLRQSVKDAQKAFKPVRTSRRSPPFRQQMTIRKARERVMAWFREHGFSNDHRVERVQKTFHDQGYALPGWDTPAAGWLLPEIATEVPTIRDGVVYEGSRYLDPDSAIEPGYQVPLRALVQDAQRPQRVFVVYGDPPLVRALHLAGRA
jgi:hypothetical protein